MLVERKRERRKEKRKGKEMREGERGKEVTSIRNYKQSLRSTPTFSPPHLHHVLHLMAIGRGSLLLSKTTWPHMGCGYHLFSSQELDSWDVLTPLPSLISPSEHFRRFYLLPSQISLFSPLMHIQLLCHFFVPSASILIILNPFQQPYCPYDGKSLCETK